MKSVVQKRGRTPFRCVVIGIALAALGATAGADPDAAKRKSTPDKFVKAASEAFGEALAADQKGDLRTALGLYQKAHAIAPHPNTAYNMGDVYRRLNQLTNAIESFETYLALLPDAADRKDAETIIDKLARTPGTLFIKTSPPSDPNAVTFKDAYILVDGVIKVKPGTQPTPQPKLHNELAIAIEVPAGNHRIDVVSAITYARDDCKVGPGLTETCNISGKPRIDGRVVFSSHVEDDIAVRIERGKAVHHDRVELPPGRRKLMVRDRFFECPPVVVDIPSGAADIAYVYFTTTEFDGLQRCRQVDTRVHKLHFDP